MLRKEQWSELEGESVTAEGERDNEVVMATVV